MYILVNVLYNNCKQNIMSLSLLVGTAVADVCSEGLILLLFPFVWGFVIGPGFVM